MSGTLRRIEMKSLFFQTSSVGRKIVTRCPGPLDERGNGDLDEITLFYKPEEGTSVERMAVLNAVDEVSHNQPFLSFGMSTLITNRHTKKQLPFPVREHPNSTYG